MRKIAIAVYIAAGAFAVTPSLGYAKAGSPPARETAPVKINSKQVMDLQQRLNERGFDAGRVDGLWGPETSAALKQFQQRQRLRASGELDHRTWVALGMVGTGPVLATPAPSAPAPTPAAPTPAATTPAATTPAATTPMPAMKLAPPPAPTLGTAAPVTSPPSSAASTPAPAPAPAPAPVAATPAPATPPPASTANARQPAHGANSFTEDQARGRIADNGFQGVHDLSLDSNGVWRGTAMKNGQSVLVWLDYTGAVGQQ